MEMAGKYQQSNPWPKRNKERVLFILDSRNSFEEDLLKQWIHHHRANGSEEFDAPQVCLALGDDRKTIDSAQLVIALALPADTLVAPLRIAWVPTTEDIESGPRLRNLFFGDPRHPKANRARKILAEAPERMHLLAGAPDSVANLRTRFEYHHNTEGGDAQKDFAEFVGRQAALVLDIAASALTTALLLAGPLLVGNRLLWTLESHALLPEGSVCRIDGVSGNQKGRTQSGNRFGSQGAY